MLVVEELGKTFGGLTALFGIDFEVEKGSITGIIGTQWGRQNHDL